MGGCEEREEKGEDSKLLSKKCFEHSQFEGSPVIHKVEIPTFVECAEFSTRWLSPAGVEPPSWSGQGEGEEWEV